MCDCDNHCEEVLPGVFKCTSCGNYFKSMDEMVPDIKLRQSKQTFDLTVPTGDMDLKITRVYGFPEKYEVQINGKTGIVKSFGRNFVCNDPKETGTVARELEGAGRLFLEAARLVRENTDFQYVITKQDDTIEESE